MLEKRTQKSQAGQGKGWGKALVTNPQRQPESPSMLVCPHTQAQPKCQAPPKDSFHSLYRTAEGKHKHPWMDSTWSHAGVLIALAASPPAQQHHPCSLGCHRKCSLPRKPIIRYLLVIKAGCTHTNSSPCFGFLRHGQECLNTALTPQAVHPSGITTSPALPDVVHGEQPAALNPGALHITALKARTGDAQSLWNLVTHPQRQTSTIAAGRQREPGDSTLGISSISASQTTHPRCNRVVNRVLGWWKRWDWKTACCKEQTAGRPKHTALLGANRHKEFGTRQSSQKLYIKS